MTWLIPSLYLLFYAGVHSLLAAQRVKDHITAWFPGIAPHYRLLYSIFSLLTLIPLPFLPRPGGVFYIVPSPYSYALYAVQILGITGFLWSLRHTDAGYFIGYTHNNTPETLTTEGAYGLCRHPLYLFSAITLLASPNMTHAYALLTAWALLYFWIGSCIEERRLICAFGNPYRVYQLQTPRFIPFFRQRR